MSATETTIDKASIIEAIQQSTDERILFAISRLLQIEEAIPQWHKELLDERLKSMENGTAVFHDWDDVKNTVFNS